MSALRFAVIFGLVLGATNFAYGLIDVLRGDFGWGVTFGLAAIYILWVDLTAIANGKW